MTWRVCWCVGLSQKSTARGRAVDLVDQARWAGCSQVEGCEVYSRILAFQRKNCHTLISLPSASHACLDGCCWLFIWACMRNTFLILSCNGALLLRSPEQSFWVHSPIYTPRLLFEWACQANIAKACEGCICWKPVLGLACSGALLEKPTSADDVFAPVAILATCSLKSWATVRAGICPILWRSQCHFLFSNINYMQYVHGCILLVFLIYIYSIYTIIHACVYFL